MSCYKKKKKKAFSPCLGTCATPTAIHIAVKMRVFLKGKKRKEDVRKHLQFQNSKNLRDGFNTQSQWQDTTDFSKSWIKAITLYNFPLMPRRRFTQRSRIMYALIYTIHILPWLLLIKCIWFIFLAAAFKYVCYYVVNLSGKKKKPTNQTNPQTKQTP